MSPEWWVRSVVWSAELYPSKCQLICIAPVAAVVVVAAAVPRVEAVAFG